MFSASVPHHLISSSCIPYKCASLQSLSITPNKQRMRYINPQLIRDVKNWSRPHPSHQKAGIKPRDTKSAIDISTQVNTLFCIFNMVCMHYQIAHIKQKTVPTQRESHKHRLSQSQVEKKPQLVCEKYDASKGEASKNASANTLWTINIWGFKNERTIVDCSS